MDSSKEIDITELKVPETEQAPLPKVRLANVSVHLRIQAKRRMRNQPARDMLPVGTCYSARNET
jgi:hypothetical protein